MSFTIYKIALKGIFETMILTSGTGKFVDTERDLTAAERHILQKLFAWETMASSLEEFRKKKQEAFQRGWNQSGPVPEREVMKVILADLEKKVAFRLSTTP